jgi:hypothetical protein
VEIVDPGVGKYLDRRPGVSVLISMDSTISGLGEIEVPPPRDGMLE